MKTSIAAVALGLILAMAMVAAAGSGSVKSSVKSPTFHASMIGGGQFPPVW
jgi:hypothetical protein